MTIDPDAYAIWGDWDLDQFRVQVPRWRDTTHPPDDVVDTVTRWWPRLKQPAEWAGAGRVSPAVDPEGNLHWLWVPQARWLDESHAYFRVQCYFRVFADEKPPRLQCVELRTVRAMSPAEVDRADGMG